MANDVGQLASLQEKLTARIREQFADLIPQEMWQGLVQQQMHAFMEKDLPTLVKDEMKKVAMEALQAELRKPEWQENWYSQGGSSALGPRASEMVKKIVVDCAPELVSALFAGVATSIVMKIRDGSMGRF